MLSTAVICIVNYQVIMFVTVEHFHPSLTFSSSVGGAQHSNIQHNKTQHKWLIFNTQHNGIQHNDTQLKWLIFNTKKNASQHK